MLQSNLSIRKETNYRPICHLTSFSKIFNNLIYSRLYKHECTNKILVREQYGFRINSYKEAAFYNVINEILKGINNRFSVGGKFCDFEKAFDFVNYVFLVDKLEFSVFVGPCHHGMARPQFADEGTAPDMEGSCE